MDQRWNGEKQRMDEEQSGTEIQTTLQEAKRKRMEIHDQRSCDRDQDLKDQGKDRDKDWSSFIPTADAENKKDLESSPKNEIGKRQRMTPSEDKRASNEEACCGERPYPNEALREEDMVSAGMKWTKRKGIWTKNSTWLKREACEIDPDLLPGGDEESKTKQKMDWTQVNGIWTRFSEQDPDIPADILVDDPDILANTTKGTELTRNVLVEETVTTPPLKRLRKKTTPSDKHITQNNNITVAYATSMTTTTNRTTTITQKKAQVTRGDLLSTSKYYQYHKAMGHAPQHIQQVSGKQKNDFLLKVVFRHTCTNKSISFKINRQEQKTKNKCIHNAHIAPDLLVPSSVRASSGE